MSIEKRKPRRQHGEAPKNGTTSAPKDSPRTVSLDFDLEGVSARPVREPGPPAPLPELATLDRWQEALRQNDDASAWLHARGLSASTCASVRLGYRTYLGRPAIVMPIVTDRIVTNIKHRFLDESEPKYMAMRGRPHGLYPSVPLGLAVLLAEGEFDALIARQHGLPAVSGTAGIEGWEPEWTRKLTGRSVAVCFDAGAGCLELAERRVRELRAAGIRDAWPVDLTLAGFKPGEDLTNWFVEYGWSAKELRAFVNDARRHYKSEAA